MPFRGIFVRLRAYFDSNSIPTEKQIWIINIHLHIIKHCNLNIYALFYCMDAIQSKLTYILFYNVFILKVIVNKFIS